jgi:large subunit ribosomal protein L7/L12
MAEETSETTTVEIDGEVKELGDRLAALTLNQAVVLGDYLKDTYGIEPAAGGAVMMAGPASDEGDAEEEKTTFDVVLTGAGDKKIQVIKTVREVTGLGLKEAKALVDGAPKAVKEALPKEEAEALANKFKEKGAEVELK